MGRPLKVVIDRDELLVGIARAHREDVAELQAFVDQLDAAGSSHGSWRERTRLMFRLRDVADYGTRYDLDRFLGRPLSSTERIRTQEAVRVLESMGLVVRSRKDIRPTEAGYAAADRILAERNTDAAALYVGAGI